MNHPRSILAEIPFLLPDLGDAWVTRIGPEPYVEDFTDGPFKQALWQIAAGMEGRKRRRLERVWHSLERWSWDEPPFFMLALALFQPGTPYAIEYVNRFGPHPPAVLYLGEWFWREDGALVPTGLRLGRS